MQREKSILPLKFHTAIKPKIVFENKNVEMDGLNNPIGRDIASCSNFMLMMKVKFALDKGQTNYISPRDSNGAVIPGISKIIPELLKVS